MRLIASCGLTFSLASGCAGVKHYEGVKLTEGRKSRALQPLDLARHAAASVGVVETNVSRGLAFVVASDGYLLTNRHVIEDADHIEKIDFPALSPPQSFGSVRVVYIDPSRDLALLKVDPQSPLPALALGTNVEEPMSRYLAEKDRVLLLDRVVEGEDQPAIDGRELEVGFVAHLGRVRETRTYNEAVGQGPFFGVSNDVQRGQSGGPVLDRYGRAIGVVTWTWKHQRGGYAIPISEAVDMLATRPKLDNEKVQKDRLQSRVEHFITALYGGRVDDARRMISPTYARKVRTHTIEAMAEAMAGDGKEAVFEFIKGLEEMLAEAASGEERKGFERMHEWVLATGTDPFLEKLGLGAALDRNQVVSFFFEFSQSYISSRRWGGQGPEAAIDAALLHLQTLDAARTFAFAELSSKLDDRKVHIEKVEIIPGVYAPQAVVTLEIKSTDDRTAGQRLVLQMRLEWGDWYMAQLQTQGVAA